MSVKHLISGVSMSKFKVDAIERRAQIVASGQVLCEQLPANFYELDEDEMDQFVVENACQLFENWSADSLWRQIDSVAYDLIAFHKAEQRKNTDE
jgi:hypothetical protein